MTFHVKRRAFLQLGLVVAGAGAGAVWGVRNAGWFGPEGIDLLRALADGLPEAVIPVGVAARRNFRWYVDEITLADRLLLGWDGSPLEKWLLARAREDYAVEDHLRVLGWNVSLTEARLYALAAMRRRK